MIDESNMIQARENHKMKMEATLIQQAIASAFGEKGRALFQNTLNSIYTESELRSVNEHGKQ